LATKILNKFVIVV